MFKKSNKENNSNEKKEKKEKKNKVKLREKISLNFRRRYLVDGTRVLLIAFILLLLYAILNIWASKADLPKIDVTENQLYTLSDTSKNAIAKLDKDITIYIYGFGEDSNIVDLIKQYTHVNDNISYEMLTEESNYEMVQKYSLTNGYYVLILKTDKSEKVIDSSELTTYDYTTYQSVDIAEQTITNSLLALNEENKPKIYFSQGHSEYTEEMIGVLLGNLQLEAYDVSFINLATAGSIPDDCDTFVIMSPISDFFDAEINALKDYINKGGNIYCSFDVLSNDVQFTNLQTVLDEYGVSVENGYILEYADGSSLKGAEYVFIPKLSTTHEITRDIYSDSIEPMWLQYSGKLNFKSDEELENLNVSKEILLNSSDEATFVTDLKSDLSKAAETAELGKADIAAVLTKTIANTEGENTNSTTSKLIIVSSARFIADTASELSLSKPLSNLACNKDFVINSLAFLSNRNNLLTIRKDYASSTYLPTRTENLVVLAIIILFPIVIIITGIMIWAYRQRRK